MNKDNLKKIFLILFFIIIACFPKFNIITIPGSRTGIRLDDIMFLIYFIIFSYGIYKEGFKKYGKLEKITKVFIICMFSFLISNILGCLRGNVSVFLSTLHLIRKIQYFMLIFAGYDYYKIERDKDNLINVLKAILLFHTVFMVLTISKIMPDISNLIGRGSGERAFSTFSGPYEFAGFLLILLPMFLNKVFNDKKYLNTIYIALILIEIVLSESRISLIAFIIITFVVIFVKTFSKNRMLGLSIPIFVVVLLSTCLINPLKIEKLKRFSSIDFNSFSTTINKLWNTDYYDYYKEHNTMPLDHTIYTANKDLSFSIRISKWTTLIKEAIKVPVFGMGLSLAGEAMDGSFVRLFVEVGIVGLVLWCLLLFTLLKESRKFNKDNYFIILGMVLSLIIGSTFIDIFEASKVMMPFWFIVGFIYSYENEKYYINKEKIKVAHIMSGMNFGGVENVIYNYYNNMDDEKFENIIISHSKINKKNSRLFDKNKFKFYGVTSKRESLFKNYKQIKKILKQEQPDIVHVHMGDSSYIALMAAFSTGIRIRICHAHTNNDLSGLKGKITKLLCNIYSNNYMACSKNACNNLFYKKNRNKCIILNNAIDLKIFDYNEKTRKKVRKEYNIEKKHVIGHVGRLSIEKNHEKLIMVFKEVLKRDKNAILMMIGDGEYKNEIVKMIKDIKENTILVKSTSDIADYYNAMDVFVFPSLKEGLGMSVIEAQISGLNCIVSDLVPKEVKQTELVEFVSIEDDSNVWADKIIDALKNKRKSHLKELTNSNYNIEKEAKCLSDIYNNLYIKYI